MPLPVTEILPQLRAALAQNAPVALTAPPGAGKTTALPPALLTEPWVQNAKILVLAPRRLAARAAAERMAETAGEPIGQTFGYRTRLDSRTSANTRIEVVTTGIYTRQLIANPELPGIAAVLFDEIHERSLETDLALALTLEAREALRPDLRLLLMSATLDGAAWQSLIPDLIPLESAGRMFPVTLHHIGRDATKRLEDQMASTILSALSTEPGSILAFLPGVAEIERTAVALEARLPSGIDLHRLHGTRDAADQRAAIRPAPAGTRKIVLATSIAETSVTIDGVRTVIDSGLARRPRFDRAVGLTRLVTERASQAAVTQRAGRAGRTEAGTAIRLWDAGETAGRPRHDPPEILESDLAGLTLETACWGAPDPLALRWRDPPPAAALADARQRLITLGALTPEGRVTPHGKAIAAQPLPPPLAHMLVTAAAQGHAQTAARIALLLTERGLGGQSRDLDDRLRSLGRDRSPRAEAARRLADNWAKAAGSHAPATDAPLDLAARLLALAFPDRVARRRGPPGAPWLMANGRAVTLPADDPLTAAPWLVVADASGSAAGARLHLAAVLDPTSVEALFADTIETRATSAFDPATTGVTIETSRHLGAITLSRSPADRPDPAAITAALLDGVRNHGLAQLSWGDASTNLRARIAFARRMGLTDLPDTTDEALLDTLEAWLAPALASCRRLTDLDDSRLAAALASQIDWASTRTLDSFAPRHFTTPAGSNHEIDYTAPAGPAVDVRVQALFGLATHPTVANGRQPLTLRLTSPAGRPVQVTNDLPRFWAGSWADVRRDLRGRYPKHPWPEDPTSAPPTLRARPRS
jgi:ATP-dependent helicase HrpB